MVEPGLGERAEGLVRDADRGGDEIGVETGGMGAGSDIDEVAARAGLAASPKTRTQVAVSSSSSLASSASGLEQ
jgi:hypothetical protein